MNVSILILGSFIITAYRSVPEQTDATPFITSIGEHTNEHGVAVSQDLLQTGQIHYGDVLYIEGVGVRIVNDCMAKRMKNRFDIWVPTYDAEHSFEIKHKGKKLKVWVIKVQGVRQ